MTSNGLQSKASSSYEDEQIGKHTIALIALFQGLILALIYTRVELQLWPANNLSVLNATVVFALSFPTLFVLISSKNDWKKVASYLLLFCASLSALGAYIGSITLGKYYGELLFVFTMCAIVASFKAALYIKSFANKWEMNYALLFTSSWRNFVLGAETTLFCGIFFAILFLGASLFSILGITLFEELLENQWFWVPALSLSVALAIHVFRNIIHTVDTAATILQTLMKFLLPLLVFVSIGFIGTLPFTGLETLWETGSGTALVLTLQALTLFFVNAVYHEGSDKRPYGLYLHRAIIIGVAVLPIYSIISAYGLWLRVDQYGLSVERCWALIIWLIFCLFSTGYFIGIVKLRDNWLEAQSKINVAMGLLVLLLSMLIQSPLLNFQSLAASSQLTRFENGEVALEDFDIEYFVYHLHKPGKEALEELKLKIADEHPEFVTLIDKKYASRMETITKERMPSEVEHYWPNKKDVQDSLIIQLRNDSVLQDVYTGPYTEVHIVKVDANNDGNAEYLVIKMSQWSQFSYLYYRENEEWTKTYVNAAFPKTTDIKTLLETNEVELRSPTWQNIKIGDVLIETN
jgi:hypothetical protein